MRRSVSETDLESVRKEYQAIEKQKKYFFDQVSKPNHKLTLEEQKEIVQKLGNFNYNQFHDLLLMKDQDRNSFLHHVTKNSYHELLSIALQNLAPLNIYRLFLTTNNFNQNHLHISFINDNANIITPLLEKLDSNSFKNIISAQDCVGNTPMRY